MPIAINGTGPITGITSLNTTVSDTELGYLDGVTSALQTQINGAGGLVYITGTSFSAASSVSVNNCFTSTYDNYLIQMDCSAASASNQIAIRLRASGSDNATAGNYVWGGLYSNLTGTAAMFAYNGGASATGFFVWYGNSTNAAFGQAYIYSPALTRLTRITATSGNLGSDVSWTGGHMSVTTAYDGFSIVAASGNLTGTLRVYGYRNS